MRVQGGAGTEVEIRHFHLFCGLGGGAVGMQAGCARVGNLRARMRCVGGIDHDPRAVADFSRIVGVRATYLDLFDREQFQAWHGKAPPEGWVEAGPDDIRKAVIGGLTPDIAFLSPPCKASSGLQNPKRAASPKYQALNRLTIRGIWLLLQAFLDDPIPLIILENVPRIQTAGRELLDGIIAMLECAGYAVSQTVHDCGEVGGLAQHRKRFLLVARHRAKVPAFLYEAPRKPVRPVGDVIGRMPLPGLAGQMHQLPKIEWRTWCRLALVPAGKDWRALQDLPVGPDGFVEGIRLIGEVRSNSEASPVPDARARETVSPRTGRVSDYGQYGVVPWEEPSHTITSEAAPGSGHFSVADPRLEGNGADRGGWTRFGNALRVTSWDETAPTITSTRGGDQAISDPRLGCDVEDKIRRRFNDVLRVVRWDEAAGTVTGATGNARPSVADPGTRMGDPVPTAWKGGRASFEGGGHYGVADWAEPSTTVVGHAKVDRSRFSVADQRIPLYEPKEKVERPPVIVSLDGTWHRPFTTLELAALQGFDWTQLTGRPLAGTDDAGRRERIGNAVPPPAAAAIASTMAETLLLARLGETRAISATPVWVMPVAVALSVDQ